MEEDRELLQSKLSSVQSRLNVVHSEGHGLIHEGQSRIRSKTAELRVSQSEIGERQPIFFLSNCNFSCNFVPCITGLAEARVNELKKLVEEKRNVLSQREESIISNEERKEMSELHNISFSNFRNNDTPHFSNKNVVRDPLFVDILSQTLFSGDEIGSRSAATEIRDKLIQSYSSSSRKGHGNIDEDENENSDESSFYSEPGKDIAVVKTLSRFNSNLSTASDTTLSDSGECFDYFLLVNS